jgi:hypothetical protein
LRFALLAVINLWTGYASRFLLLSPNLGAPPSSPDYRGPLMAVFRHQRPTIIPRQTLVAVIAAAIDGRRVLTG